jgi:hypothetical protein
VRADRLEDALLDDPQQLGLHLQDWASMSSSSRTGRRSNLACAAPDRCTWQQASS